RHTRSKRDWSSDVCSSDLCSRCDRTIEMWHRASRHTSFHTFQGGVLDGQEMTSHDLQDHPEWADYTIVEASEEDMFSINPMFVRSEERRVGKEDSDRRYRR